MRVLKDSEYLAFKQLAQLTQDQMIKAMRAVLETRYTDIIATKEYIVAKGDIPIGLVAHMDTVFPLPPTEIYYDTTQNVVWSPQGLGADDRAGIFAILQILKTTKLRPHIILTTDEEKGGWGAYALVEQYPDFPFDDLKYLIQLDRQGANDCVFYDGINEDFIRYISSFGFVERIGSFSDISILCPFWDVCGVNLSVGYKNEHNLIETLNISHLFDTIQKVKRMLMVKDIPDFEWKEKYSLYYTNGYPLDDDIDEYSAAYGYNWVNDRRSVDAYTVICHNCKKPFYNYETFPTKKIDGGTMFLCPDCVGDHANWCDCCGEAFERTPENAGATICPDCAKIEKIKVKS